MEEELMVVAEEEVVMATVTMAEGKGMAATEGWREGRRGMGENRAFIPNANWFGSCGCAATTTGWIFELLQKNNKQFVPHAQPGNEFDPDETALWYLIEMSIYPVAARS
ncbi:hypothetical protein H5410_018535 [Solanum commersonii]|uniref:Uncharacterized protein n=1 Tax=Solanum commersonii TaxID=4109 RepID=A0A9J6A3N4_SOLCO|nr:hypothetical protein H5410_018535 [Solanum commersonii]